MNAEVPIRIDSKPRWQRRISVALRRSPIVPTLEIAALVALLTMALVSYFIVTRQGAPEKLLSPPSVAAMLVATLVPAMALMVLVARRVALRRAADSAVGGGGGSTSGWSPCSRRSPASRRCWW